MLVALASCAESEDEGVRTVAGWVDGAIKGGAMKPAASPVS
jgi:hypothetical protein